MRNSAISPSKGLRLFLFICVVAILTQLLTPGESVIAQDPCADPSNEIVAENCLPGNPASDWDVSGAGDTSIQGFASDISVNRGGAISFKIDDTAAGQYDIKIYRLGYYSGAGARLVHTIPGVTGVDQPDCTLADIPIGGGSTTNGKLLDCGNWSVSATWSVPAGATSGVYIARSTRADNSGSHIPFIVRDDAGDSDLLFQTSDTTWQSYNPYGGYNAYGSSGATMAEKLSYNRPFTLRGAELENWLFNAEYPMIRWLERNGYDVSYFSAVDTERYADLLDNHQVFLSVGHDEYWSQGRRDAVTAARDAGVDLAFFSANEIYWKTRWEPSTIAGGNYRTQVVYKEGDSAPSNFGEHRNCYQNFDCDPSDIWTGQWRQAPGSTPENSLSGQISWRQNDNTPLTVPGEYAPLRFWRDTDVAELAPTDQVTLANGTLGYEWDPEFPQYADFYPAGRVLLSETTATSFTGVPEQHHLSLYRAPTGALVFGAGTVQWSWGLDSNHDYGISTEDRNMQQATVNLLADMGAQPATLQTGLVAATASTDTTPPTVNVTSPPSGSTVPGGAVTITGTASDAGGVVGVVEISTNGGTTWQRATGGASWSYTYTAVDGPADIRIRAADDSVNLSAPISHTFTVEPRVCPCSIWPDTITPATINANDNQGGIEVGVKLRANQDGYITGLRYYWAPGDTGTHTGNLWAAGGAPLATAVFPAPAVAGWQTVALDAPVPIAAGATYIASQYSSTGNYSFTGGYFATEFANPPLTAPADEGDPNPNGVYKYGASGFPTSHYGASNYWVDVVFATDVGPDTTPPTIVQRTPAPNAVNIALTSNVTVVFGEPIDEATLASNFELRDADDQVVNASVSYDAPTRTATLNPAANLAAGAIYTALVRGGATGVADLAGNRLAANSTWSFTVATPPTPRPDPNVGPGGPILVVKGTGVFGAYLPEIMRAEGLNLFAVGTLADLTEAGLAPYKSVVLGQTTLTAGQVTALTGWVNTGGNLVTLRPDPELAGLLGLTVAGGTLSEGYIKVDTASAPGAGIVGQTMQFHGTADQYTAEAGTQVVATLYSNATTATTYPAVTLLNVGAGSAAAFTYDLAGSVVLTRQGNPAWVNINGDGSAGPFRADDLFHQTNTDYVDLSKVAIPQADEQQRLLANILTEISRDTLPLPRFWYLPRGEVAALVMTADEHNDGNVPNRFNAELAASADPCSVDDWECIRSTSYLYPSYPSMSAAQASAFEGQGFEIALHPDTNCQNYARAQFADALSAQLDALDTKYPSLQPSVTSRNHCISWTDYTTIPEELATQGIHLDTNYYYWPGSWINDRPGLFTGSGFPQRFATTTGELIDVYQAATQMTDESGMTYPATAIALMENAINLGYYGTFTLNFHTDGAGNTYHGPVVQAAKDRSVPVITARQLLTWTDGRNASSFGNVALAGNSLTFDITVGTGANGLRAMVPVQGATGVLQALERADTPVTYETKTIKGVQYAVFPAAAGAYTASYAADTTPPTITDRVPAADAVDVAVGANVVVTFSEPIDPATATSASVTLRAQGATTDVPAAVSTDGAVVTLNPTNNLAAATVYTVTVAASVADVAGLPLGTPATWSFTTAAGPTCPCNIFGITPGGTQTVDNSSLELGVKFRADIAGWITGVRFYKPAGSTGTHVGKLWQANGTLLASATYVETASGWQEVSFDNPVAITANTTYVASYSWPGGYYPYEAGAFTNAGVTTGPLTALQAGAEGPNGVYSVTPGLFPTLGLAANYFADVIFTTVLETTPPTVTATTPANNATEVPVGSAVTVTFSEAMNAATITTGTFELRDAANSLVAAAVSYNGATHTATLTPSAALSLTTQYTAKVKGGVDGVKDAAGNALAADFTWSFTTAADNCPCSIWNNSFTPVSSAVEDDQSIEVGTKFRSSAAGQITALRFYKGVGDTDTHVGHLWTSTGTLLATVTSTNETASGWQEVALPAPVPINANTTYIASFYSSPAGYFSITLNGLAAPLDNPPLRALAADEDGPNGVYKYGGGFPTGGTNNNYWIDVVFDYAGPDTTPPVITNLAAAPSGDGTATITWTTDEPANSLVEYGTAPGALNQSESAAALVTAHSLTLAGLAPNTTFYYRVTSADADDNPATEPPVGQPPASFTTPGLTFIDTTATDFAAGTGTCAVDATIGNGAVRLPLTVDENFSGTNLPAGWAMSPWTGGTATFDGNAATVDGARLATDSYYAPGRSLEFVATFGAATFQHVGFGQLLAEQNGEYWAMFGTWTSTNTLHARTNVNGAVSNVPLTGNWLGIAHRFRIDWTATAVVFSIDGNVVHTETVNVPAANMRPLVSDYQSGAPAVVVDWIRLSPYVSPCTFTSRTFDAGQPADWQTLLWNGQTPADTSVVFETRTSDNSTDWSDWAAVGGGGAIAGPNARYIQYRAVLTSTNANATPVVVDVSLAYALVTNQPPVATEDAYNTNEDTPLNVPAPGVLGNDTDSNAGDTLTAVLVDPVAHGMLTLNADGSFTYTPAANYNGPDSFTYKVNDGARDSNVATVTITVTAANDAPVANDDAYPTDEDTLLTVTAPGVLANDTDIDSATLTAVVVANPTHGTLTLNADGSFTYTPAANFVGDDTFTYKASDGAFDSNVAKVTITVGGTNDAPVAVDDAHTTNEDTGLNVPAAGVLGNDSDADGDTLTAVLVASPAHGSLTLNPNGSFTYAPDENFNGSDTFTYQASDGTLLSNVATVTITVDAVNDVPVANDQSVTTAEDTATAITLVASDADGDTLSYIIVAGPAHGTLSGGGSALIYAPAANYNGPDSFTFKVNDGMVDSNVATVTITVTAANDAPTITNPGDQASAEGDTVSLQIVAADVDSATLTYSVTGLPNGLTINPATGLVSGSIAYDAAGTYNVTVTVTDGELDANTTFTWVVGGTNRPPVAIDDTFAGTEDVTLTLPKSGTGSPAANDTDPDSDPLAVTAVGSAVGGTVALVGEEIVFTPTPNLCVPGAASFTYTVSDGSLSDQGLVTLNLTCENDAPVLGTIGNKSIAELAQLTFTATATDIDSATLVFSLTGAPTGAAIDPDSGAFTWTPTEAQGSGTYTFDVVVTDGGDLNDTETITVTVSEVNVAPVLEAIGDKTVAEGATLDVSLAASDTDHPAQVLSFSLAAGAPDWATLVDAGDGTVTLHLAPDYGDVSDDVTVCVSDGVATAVCETITVTVTDVNRAPVANGQSMTTAEDTPKAITLVASDPDGDTLTFEVIDAPTHGDLSGTGSALTYTPTANYNGPDSFTFKVNDGTADSNVATVTITVTAVNDVPVANDDTYTTAEDTLLTVTAPGVLANDTDVDNATLTAVVVANPHHGTLALNANGSFTYTPDDNFVGEDTFTYKASDGTANSNTATVTINVGGTNDTPVAVDDPYTTNEDTALDVPAPGILANDTDADDDPLTAVLVAGPTHGTLTLNANGSFTYTPDDNFVGEDSFTYKANDGAANSNTATVTITVGGTNDAPVANDQSVTTAEDTAKSITLTGSDPDGDTLTYIVVSSPAHGTLSGAGSALTYTPATNYNGLDSFTFKVNDGTADSNSATVTITVTEAPPEMAEFFLSTSGTATLGGIAAAPADILRYEKTANRWTMVYDGSVRGTIKNISAFHLMDDGSILLVFGDNQPLTIGGAVATATPYDVVKFTPNNPNSYPLGPGAYSWFFQGRSKGLSTPGEKIDAMDLSGDRLLLSMTGVAKVTLPNGTNLKAADEDVFFYDMTANRWGAQLLIDGSLIPGMAGEDLSSIWDDPDSDDYYITITGAFTIGGVKGDGKSIVKLSPNGGETVFTPSLVTWLAPGATFSTDLDGLDIGQ